MCAVQRAHEQEGHTSTTWWSQSDCWHAYQRQSCDFERQKSLTANVKTRHISPALPEPLVFVSYVRKVRYAALLISTQDTRFPPGSNIFLNLGVILTCGTETCSDISHQCCHVSPLWEDQCVVPSARAPNGGGGRGYGVGGEADGRRALNGCNANGIRGHGNQFTLLKQMRAARPGRREHSLPLFFGRPGCYCN